MLRSPARRWTPLLLVLLLLTVAGPAVADAGHGTTPRSSSPVQDQIADLYTLVGWMSVVISVLVLGALVYIIFKFRTDPGDESAGSWFTHNNKLEITWTIVTAIILVYLGVVTAQTMDQIGTSPMEESEERIDIVAVGQQWYWEFVYPDGNRTENVLHVEANRTYRVHVASCDVIHALYIPNLGVKMDTTVVSDEKCKTIREDARIPDKPRLNAVTMMPRAGTFELQCAEFCGAAHAFMEGKVVAFQPGTREKPYGPPPELGEVHHLEVADANGNLTLTPSTVELNTGDLTTWFVHNNATTEVTVALPAPLNVTTGAIAPGETAEARFTATAEGTFNVTVNGDALGELTVSSGTIRDVKLSDRPWYIRDGSQFEPGETYAIRVWNNGSMPHNLYIGTFKQNRDAREALFKTETFPAGEYRWLNVTMPNEDVTLDWWCDVPGHAGAGMLDEIQVGQGGKQGTSASKQSGPLLTPSVGLLSALAGLSAAALAVRRWRER